MSQESDFQAAKARFFMAEAVQRERADRRSQIINGWCRAFSIIILIPAIIALVGAAIIWGPVAFILLFVFNPALPFVAIFLGYWGILALIESVGS